MSPPAPASHRSFVWLILIAAVAAGLGLWFGSRQFGVRHAAPLATAILYPAPRAVAPFELAQANGKPLANADWLGHWNVVYFGYASCPDVCPTTLAALKQVWKELGEQHLQDRVRVDFISVDPQRDTSQVLQTYTAFFSADFVAATGSDEQLTTLTRSLGLLYARTTKADGTIEVDHSGSAVIIDPRGRLVGIFRPPFMPKPIAADLAALIATDI